MAERLHEPSCAVHALRAQLAAEIAGDPRNQSLLGAWPEYFGGGDQEVEECTCANVRCMVCGGAVTSGKPDRYPYCAACHYSGAAFEDLSREQIARFNLLLPEGWQVGVEHTGGGCFWLAARKAHEERYYIFTDGEAALPVDECGERLPNGGWGYVGSQVDDDEGTPRDDNFHELYYSLQAAGGDPEFGLSDEAAVALVTADIAASS